MNDEWQRYTLRILMLDDCQMATTTDCIDNVSIINKNISEIITLVTQQRLTLQLAVMLLMSHDFAINKRAIMLRPQAFTMAGRHQRLEDCRIIDVTAIEINKMIG